MNREIKDKDREREKYDSKMDRGDTVTSRYENTTERLGGMCERQRKGTQTRGDMGTPEGEDSEDCKRERSDVRKMDGLTQMTEREIIERQGNAVKAQRMVARGKKGHKRC